MGENTPIEWAKRTFNPWIGCTKVSPGCDHCYAERFAHRFGGGWGPGAPRRLTSESNWKLPLRWNRAAEKAGRRDRVFCASLADVFDAEVPDEWRDRLFALILLTLHLDWLLLTKRPHVALKYIDRDRGDLWNSHAGPMMHWDDMPTRDDWPLSNLWLGTSAENDEMARLRIPHILRVPAARHFVSLEPLLGHIDMRPYFPGVDWVIVGGESGPKARLMHPDWARSIRDQCVAAGVPFFFKQWGGWLPWEPDRVPCWRSQNGQTGDRHVLFPSDFDTAPEWDDGLTEIEYGHAAFQHVGKKAAGRELDGREWNEGPA